MESRLGDRPCYEFGEFRLDANRRVIEARAANRRLPLPPRIFDAALYFVRHRGLLLTKERLLAELWPGMVVEENSLSQVISLLRRALGESRRDNRYIVTVPRRGYRFVAEVVRVAGRANERAPGSLTVEVLSFENLSTQRRRTPGGWNCREHSASAGRGPRLPAGRSRRTGPFARGCATARCALPHRGQRATRRATGAHHRKAGRFDRRHPRLVAAARSLGGRPVRPRGQGGAARGHCGAKHRRPDRPPVRLTPRRGKRDAPPAGMIHGPPRPP